MFIPEEDYVWCLHCERAAEREKWIKNNEECPYTDCDGSPLDAWPWSTPQKENNYPKRPKPDKVYPLYK